MTRPDDAVVYVRISKSTEESVSLARQEQSCRALATARGWHVAAVYADEDVSATTTRPEQRPGWRALLDSPTPYQRVIVWKVDRLARRTLDFLRADEMLRERGAGIVAVEDPVDMTTAQGRAFASVLAVFAELEAASISARGKAARRHLLSAGRVVGGRVPYGYRGVPNPRGPGLVYAQDPETVPVVRDMVRRAQRGDALYGIARALEDAEVPAPGGGARWSQSTVERVLRHPMLAGLVPYNPDSTTRTRGPGVLTDDDGLPLVHRHLAVLPLAEWRALVARLDAKERPQSVPRALRAKTSGLLSGLVWCGRCDPPVRMHRGTTQARPGYRCPRCHQTVSGQTFESYVVEQFLALKGHQPRWTVVEEVPGRSAERIAEIDRTIAEVAGRFAQTGDEALIERMRHLREIRAEVEAQPAETIIRSEPADLFVNDWAAATEPEQRRVVLGDAIQRIVIRPGRTGRGLDTGRITFEWNDPSHVGQPDHAAAFDGNEGEGPP